MVAALSQNGWPVLASGDAHLHTWVIPTRAGTVRITMRRGAAGLVLAHFVLWYAETIESIVGKVLDDWGFAARAIRGTSGATQASTSNHSSATAVDLNATQHPLGLVGTGVFRRLRIVVLLHARLLTTYAGLIRWGGDYHGRKDEMHFELIGTPSQVNTLARRLMNTPRGKRILDANPDQRKFILAA